MNNLMDHISIDDIYIYIYIPCSNPATKTAISDSAAALTTTIAPWGRLINFSLTLSGPPTRTSSMDIEQICSGSNLPGAFSAM